MNAEEATEPVDGAGEPEARGLRARAKGFYRHVLEEAATRRAQVVLGLVLPLIALAVNLARVWTFTVDDSYISYRYARNLAHGLGLVYNPGERIEGYTNFLWTVILAGGITVGIDPDVLTKVLGSASAAGTMVLLFELSRRFRPHGFMPCVATWLFASSMISVGYSVFGLETGFFVFLILAGTYQMFRETERGHGFVASALLFGLAGLTRPEAPMYLGVPMLMLGLRFFTRQNLLRGVLFASPIAAHMLWRHAYYGTWLPNTFGAKTGDLAGQVAAGEKYLGDYLTHAGPVLWLGLAGLGVAIAHKNREAIGIGVLGLCVLAYVAMVGGDWMPYFRFVAPFEVCCFLLVDLAVRSIVEARDTAANLSILVFGVVTVTHRADAFSAARTKMIKDEKVFWDSAAGGAAKWFKEHGKPGPIAVADIGYIGWVTDYPIMDLLGLVDPVISKLPGGYTHKTGDGYVQRVFDVKPSYFVLVGSAKDCKNLPFPAQMKLYRDRRFQSAYFHAGQVKHSKGGLWCIYERKADDAADFAVAPEVEKPRVAPRSGGMRLPALAATAAPTATPAVEQPDD